MSRKNINELEEQLARMKEKEAQLKEQLAMQKKAADAKAQKERNKKMYQLADSVVQALGTEEILEMQEAWWHYMTDNAGEIKDELRIQTKQRYDFLNDIEREEFEEEEDNTSSFI